MCPPKVECPTLKLYIFATRVPIEYGTPASYREDSASEKFVQ